MAGSRGRLIGRAELLQCGVPRWRTTMGSHRRFRERKNGGKPTSIYTVVDFKSGKKVWGQEYPADATALDRSPSSNSLAFVRQHNLYVTTKEGQTMAVSSDGSNDLVYGETVHRNEFGITKGTFWSPDGKQLAFYRMDQSMVPDYPQVDITTRIATTYPCKYPMAGEKCTK